MPTYGRHEMESSTMETAQAPSSSWDPNMPYDWRNSAHSHGRKEEKPFGHHYSSSCTPRTTEMPTYGGHVMEHSRMEPRAEPPTWDTNLQLGQASSYTAGTSQMLAYGRHEMENSVVETRGEPSSSWETNRPFEHQHSSYTSGRSEEKPFGHHASSNLTPATSQLPTYERHEMENSRMESNGGTSSSWDTNRPSGNHHSSYTSGGREEKPFGHHYSSSHTPRTSEMPTYGRHEMENTRIESRGEPSSSWETNRQHYEAEDQFVDVESVDESADADSPVTTFSDGKSEEEFDDSPESNGIPKRIDIRDMEVVEIVDWKQEMSTACDNTNLGNPSFENVQMVIQMRSPELLETAVANDRQRNIGEFLMAQNDQGNNFLHTLCSGPCDSEEHNTCDMISMICRVAQKRRVLLSQLNGEGCTPLHLAIRNGNVCCVDSLLKQKAPLNVLDGNNKTPLQVAYEINHGKIVEMLLLQGANYEYLLEGEKRSPYKKMRAFQRLADHSATMDSLLYNARCKVYKGFEEVETVSPVFTMQPGERNADFYFKHDAYHLTGKHCYLLFFFICDIQKKNRYDWTARCGYSDQVASLRFSDGFPALNGESCRPAQHSENPMTFYPFFGDEIDNRITVSLAERVPMVVAMQVVLVKIDERRVSSNARRF